MQWPTCTGLCLVDGTVHVAKSILDSKGEIVVHEILQKYQGRFSIHTGVRFFRVIDYNLPGLTPGEHSYLNKTEFDFVVSEGAEMRPVFAVEYDGIGADYAKIDPQRPFKKATKIKACELAKFPLLWLEPLTFIEGLSILDAVLESYVGGKGVAQMVEAGELSWEESFIYDFPPLARLNQKYGHYRSKNEILWDKKDFNHQGQRLYFRTDTGEVIIEKHASVRVVDFPFFHGLELASDIAHYRCFKEFEERLQRGEISVTQLDQRWNEKQEQMQQSKKPSI